MIGAITAGFLGGAGSAVAGDYESIQTYTLASAQSAITFSSIPTGWSHLQIRGIYMTSTNATATLTINGDTAANYSTHKLSGNGATASALSYAPNNTYIFAGAAYSTNNPSPVIIDILDYLNTNKYKTVRSLGGADANGSGQIDLASGVWLNTAAVTSVTVSIPPNNMNQYSSFALYGVK